MANEFVLRKGLISLGGVRLPFTEINNQDYTVLETDYFIEVTSSSADRTVTLPAPIEGQTYIVKNKYSSGYKVNVATNGAETIDGENTVTLSAGESLEVTTNGTNWTSTYETGKSLGAGCYETDLTSTTGGNPSSNEITAEQAGVPATQNLKVNTTQNGIDITDLLSSFEIGNNVNSGLIHITDNSDNFASFIPRDVQSGVTFYTFTVANTQVNGTLPTNMDTGSAVICFTPFTNGTSGSSGSSGSSGTSGSSGSSGSSGTSGSSGSSGSSGTSGSSGSSGTSGTATITNLGDDRILTSTGVQGEANAEANLTFDGTNFKVGGATNYLQISTGGDLSIYGTGDYLVDGNGYAFRYVGDEDYGLYFNLTNARYEFRNGTATNIFSIDAGNGSTYIDGSGLEIPNLSSGGSSDDVLVLDSDGFIRTKTAASGSSGSSGTSGTATINNNADNRIITGSATAGELNGESNLTFDGNFLDVSGRIQFQNSHGASNPSIQDTTGDYGLAIATNSTVSLVAGGSAKISMTSSGIEIFSTMDMNLNKIAFDSDSTNSYIAANTDNPEDIEIHADEDILLMADGQVGVKTTTPAYDLDVAGSIGLTGDITGNGSTLKVSEIASGIGAASAAGDKGTNAETYTAYSTTVIAGGIYYLGTSAWTISDADAASSATGLMGVATSTNSNTGMVIRGVVGVFSDPGGSVGDVCYLSTTSGRLTTTAPTAAGDIVRVMGYKIGTNLVFFNPSNDWIEL